MSRTERKHWLREEMRDGVKRPHIKRKKDAEKQELYKGDIYEHSSIYYDGFEEFEEEMDVCDYCGCLIYEEVCPC